ncbi:MAG: Holliday junction resolvase-like protein [Candidatus Thorarchaeota archaeon]
MVFPVADGDILLGLLLGLLVAVVVYLTMRYRLRIRIALVEEQFRRLWAEQESDIRRDATQRSRYVLRGRIAEHMVPIMRDLFKYDPSDARFLGSPVDYVVFDGLTAARDAGSKKPVEIVLVEIKTGNADLSSMERVVKDAADAGRIRWETIRVDL